MSTKRESIYGNKYPFVNKYQAADTLIKEILYYINDDYDEVNYIRLNCDQRAKIIGIYSPLGGCGKTIFALTLTHIYAKTNPSLYINTEEFSGLEHLFEKEFSASLSDIFYVYKMSPSKISSKIISTIQSIYNFDYIPPFNYSYDLRNIEVNEWKEFLISIIENTNYQIIVFDFSNMIKDIISLLEICDIVYTPIKNDPISQSKIQEYEEFIKQTDNRDIISKTIKIEIPFAYFNNKSSDYLDNIIISPFANFVKDKIYDIKSRDDE